MTGNELKKVLKQLGLNQKEAAEEFETTEATMSKQVNLGDEKISSRLEQRVILFSIDVAWQKVKSSIDHMNNLYTHAFNIIRAEK